MPERGKTWNGYKPFVSQNNYLNGLKCLKYAWYYQHRRDAMPAYPAATERVFDYGHMIGAKARALYPDGIMAEGPPGFGPRLEYCRFSRTISMNQG